MNNLQEVKLLCKIFSRNHSLNYAKHALIFIPARAKPSLVQRDMGVLCIVEVTCTIKKN